MSYGGTNFNTFSSHSNSMEHHQQFMPQNGGIIPMDGFASNCYYQMPEQYPIPPFFPNYNPTNQTVLPNQNITTNEKRVKKPLEIFDPNNNNVKLNLTELAQGPPKTIKKSLLDEIQCDNINNSKTIIENSVNMQNGVQESCDSNTTIYHEVVLKSSTSIPNNLECFNVDKLKKSVNDTDMSTSETNLSNKVSKNHNEKLVYIRDNLIQIGLKNNTKFSAPFLYNEDFKDIVYKENSKTALSIVNKYHRPSKKKIDIYDSYSFLRRSTKGYKPPYLRSSEEGLVNTNVSKFQRSFTIILNKIAPQNFKDCFFEIRKLIDETSKDETIMTADLIDCLIEEIFNKAVKQETYSVTYANLCLELSKLEDTSSLSWNFKGILLNRCKVMFERPLQDQLDDVQKDWENKIKEETDETLKKLFQNDIEEQLKKAKDRYFGNVRFIGELYMHKLLKATIIYNCVKSLIPKSNEQEAMMSLCKLLVTCGKEFNSNHPDKMLEIIKDLQDLLKLDCVISNKKVRFGILDIIEMSQRGWTLREIQVQKIIRPKTLEEVKIEMDEVKSNAAAVAANVVNVNSPRNTPRNQMKTSLKQSSSSNELKCKSLNQSKNTVIKPNSLTPSVNRNEDLQLRPSNTKWSCGSGVKNDDWLSVQHKKCYKQSIRKGREKEVINKNTPGENRFSNTTNMEAPLLGLTKEYESNNLLTQSPSRSQNDSPVNQFVSSSKFAILAQGDASDSDVCNPSPIADLLSQSDGRSVEDDMEDEPIFDPSELLKILLNTGKLNQHSWDLLPDKEDFLYNCFDSIMERDQLTRNSVGRIIAKLYYNKNMTLESLNNGLKAFDEQIDDLKTDIPKIWHFLSDFFEGIATFQSSHFEDTSILIQEVFSNVFSYRLPSAEVIECAILIIKSAANNLQDTDKYLKWFLDLSNETKETEQLLTKHDMLKLLGNIVQKSECKVEPICANESSDECDDVKSIKDEGSDTDNFKLLYDDFLIILSKDEESIYTFLESKFDLTLMQTEKFVFFVFDCIFRFIIDHPVSEIKSFLNSKLLFCNRTIDHKPNFENEALVALSKSADKLNEKEILEVVVTWFLANQVISSDAFHQLQQQISSDGNCPIASVISSVLDNLADR